MVCFRKDFSTEIKFSILWMCTLLPKQREHLEDRLINDFSWRWGLQQWSAMKNTIQIEKSLNSRYLLQEGLQTWPKKTTMRLVECCWYDFNHLYRGGWKIKKSATFLPFSQSAPGIFQLQNIRDKTTKVTGFKDFSIGRMIVSDRDDSRGGGAEAPRV